MRLNLGLGADNARSIGAIAESAGVSRREVERAVEDARRNGEPICTGPGGVWLTDNPAELRDNYRALRRRYIRQAVNARVLLRTARRLDGQLRLW